MLTNSCTIQRVKEAPVFKVFWLETVLVVDGTKRTNHSPGLYQSLLSKSVTLQKSEILASLKNAGFPANEDNAVAMAHDVFSECGFRGVYILMGISGISCFCSRHTNFKRIHEICGLKLLPLLLFHLLLKYQPAVF